MAMKWEIGKHIMRSPTHHHNIDEDINLQKCEGGEGGESET
jgi:hypothetical protein